MARIAVFDAHAFERGPLALANEPHGHELVHFEARLCAETAGLARGCPVACSFANDRVDAAALAVLAECGVRLVALRSAGFNHVDLEAAARLGIRVARVPAYSPYAVAEHAVALLLSLNRKLHRAHARVRELNFSLDGLVGFDLHGKTVGVIGTGRIGAAFCRIMKGFGCEVLAYDLHPDPELRESGTVRYASLEEIYARSRVISLHVPLTPATRHLIDEAAIARMSPGVLLINTSRGLLVDTRALILGLKSGHLGGAGLDVYEEEEGVFFQDLSDCGLQDDVLARLLTFPNVLITSHQAFLTEEALRGIAETTFLNIQEFIAGGPLSNEVRSPCATRGTP